MWLLKNLMIDRVNLSFQQNLWQRYLGIFSESKTKESYLLKAGASG